MPIDPKPPLPSLTRNFARELRIASTESEARIWFRIRAGRLGGYKFRRQHPVPPYVLDFYCELARLAVELDGSQHGEDEDRARTAALEKRGIAVIRFWDNDVSSRIDAVLEEILRTLESRMGRANPVPSPPAPLPVGEG